MTANRYLAAQRGIDEATCLVIDQMHEDIDAFIRDAIDNNADEQHVRQYLTTHDFCLQHFWKFPQDEKFHTLYKKYLFKKHWYGKKYKCTKTGETFTIPFEVSECGLYHVGEGYVDVGRLGFYCRFSNVVEVRDEHN